MVDIPGTSFGRRDIPSRQAGVRRQPANGHIQIQYEEIRDQNRILRQECQSLSEQTQSLQSERDSAIEDNQQLWKKMEQMQKQMQKMANSMGKGQMSWVEQESLAKKAEALSAQNQLLQARYKEDVQSLKNALEDAEQDRDNLRYKLSESKRENDKLSEKLSCLGPNYDTSKRQIEAVIAQRDKLKKQVESLERDLRAAKDKLSSFSSSTREEPERETSPIEAELSDLKAEVSRVRQESQGVVKERDRLVEENGELRSKVEQMESRVHRLDSECKRLRDSSPVRGLGKMSGRGSSEDLLAIRSRGTRGSLPYKKFSPSSADEDSDRSLQDLTSLNHSGDLSFAKKKLSSSTSNLTSSSDGGVPTRLSEANSRLRSRLVRSDHALDEVQRDNINLGAKVVRLEKERAEIELQMKRLKQELHTAQLELNKTASHYKDAQNQIQMLSKEKGVAMRDNAVSYKQSIQLESKMRELEAERQILQQQRDIANKEREKVVMESVSHKKKLEQIKSQRQKDAKELVTMKHMKDRAVSEMAELRRGNKELQDKIAGMEEEMARIRESMSHTSMKLGVHSAYSDSTSSISSRGGRGAQQPSSAAPAGRSPSLSTDLKSLMERLQVAESERNLLHKKLFGVDGSDPGHSPSMGDVLHKVESLLQERDGLVCEIEALQSSSNKLNEDRIFDLKQRIEDLMMERDTLNAQNKQQKKELSALSAQLINTEQERDKLSIEINRLGMQCQQLKSTQERLVTEHSKTLERVNELWKQKWPGAYDEQAWEEKHITLQMGSDGLAGFSVVGGRDQPQLPNPGAFIVTTVTAGGPADGLIKVGDILESVNGQSMANADHREAVRAVKESKGAIAVAVRRRRHAHPLVVGIVSAVNSVPHMDTTSIAKPEEHNFSLLVTSKDSLGFRYDWESLFRVTEVAASGPAHQILEVGDRILQINSHSVSREKPSAVKKLLKPQKNILQLVVERNSKNHTNQDTGQDMFMQEEWSEDSFADSKRSSITLSSNSTPTYKRRSHVVPETLTQMTSQSPEMESKATGYSITEKREREWDRERKREREHNHGTQPVQERESYSSSRNSYSQDPAETESQDSESKPTKLVSVVTQVKNEAAPSSSRQRPVSDGVMYGDFNERRIEYKEVLLSEQTESQYSQSESYLSESSSSYGEYCGLSSSQSIDLTFHSVSTVTHNRLTVDTMAPTQMEPSHERRGYVCAEEEGDEEYFDRLDSKRNAFRSRSNSGENSNTNNSQSQEDSPSQLSDTQLSYPEMSVCSQENGASSHRRGHKGYKRKHFRSKRKGNSLHGSSSLTKLSSPEEARTLPPRSGMASSSMGQRGRSWSNLSLSHAPSMSSVIEEPRRSTSTTNVSDMQEQDPLADATYIRANFTYIPRTPKELQIKAGDVFHIHDEAPSERFRSCFWVSRLNSDGTDERMGPIPNSIKAQEYLEAQGESLDIPIYEEVEAYTGMRPVLVFGALADQVAASLIESYPTMFYSCNTELIEGTARITEARLKREVAERKIVDFWRTDRGYEVIRLEALTGRENKGKHCLMTGTRQAFQSLKSKAPPISILIKAMQYDSIMTFSPEQITEEEARRVFNEIAVLEEQYGNEFSASLFLIYMDTLLGQIEDIVKREKRKQSWVPVTRES